MATSGLRVPSGAISETRASEPGATKTAKATLRAPGEPTGAGTKKGTSARDASATSAAAWTCRPPSLPAATTTA